MPLLVLDASGMRVGELEQLTWGDVDEQRGRWRISKTVAKTGHARWVTVPPVLFEAVMALVPREDRVSERRVFQGASGPTSFARRSHAHALRPAYRCSRRTA